MVRNTGLSFGVVFLTVTVLLLGFSDLGLAQINPDGVNLDKWEAPPAIRKAFPYYISGLDHEGQTVFIIEFGKWNIRQYFEDGGDAKDLGIYVDQMVYRWSKADKNLENTEGTGFFGLIGDFEGYDARQLGHGRAEALCLMYVSTALAFVLTMARKFVAVAAPKMDYGFLINMNYVAETLINNLVAPILGNIFSKMETSGTNKARWIPLLFKKIPKESLPTWYGGSENFRPLAVYG